MKHDHPTHDHEERDQGSVERTEGGSAQPPFRARRDVPPGSRVSSATRMTRDALLRETDEEVRNVLRYELNVAITFFLELNRTVYLDRFGLLIPADKTKTRTVARDTHLSVSNSKVRTAFFEKCYDLMSVDRSQFPDLVEVRELVEVLYPRLPATLTRRWNEREIRRLVCGMIELVRYQVVVDGYSRELGSVGEFYAIHNRQGASFDEWFGGSDIFLRPALEKILTNGKPETFQRPVLENAWELLEAAYERPVQIMHLNIHHELAQLGYDVSLPHPETQKVLHVAVFKRLGQTPKDPPLYIYCTDGLRLLALQGKTPRRLGCELVLQLLGRQLDGVEDELPPNPARALTLAWILLNSTKSRILKSGAGLTSDVGLFEGRSRDMNAVFITPFAPVSTEQLSEAGPFVYCNVVGIYSDEAKLAERYSPEYLTTLLEHRNLHQVSQPQRPSLTIRSSFIEDSGEAQSLSFGRRDDHSSRKGESAN